VGGGDCNIVAGSRALVMTRKGDLFLASEICERGGGLSIENPNMKVFDGWGRRGKMRIIKIFLTWELDEEGRVISIL